MWFPYNSILFYVFYRIWYARNEKNYAQKFLSALIVIYDVLLIRLRLIHVVQHLYLYSVLHMKFEKFEPAKFNFMLLSCSHASMSLLSLLGENLRTKII